ncbi:MAG: hypothetical protein ACQKBY_13090 [Verrucomicrobiales bacterium]
MKQKQSGLWRFAGLLALSFLLFNLGPVLEETARWTRPASGFRNGLFHVLLFGIIWFLFLFPWSLLIYGLYRWRNWRRFRSFWVLFPALLALFGSVAGLVFDPPTPEKRFYSDTGIEWSPESHMKGHFLSGGGFIDMSDHYYFETSPAVVERLVQELKLEEEADYGVEDWVRVQIELLPGCPDYREWLNATYYTVFVEDSGWFYYLLTDETRTKVYLHAGCI